MSDVNVGQLKNLSDEQLHKAVRELSPEVRMRLAHLAAYGIQAERKKITSYERVLLAVTEEQEAEG